MMTDSILVPKVVKSEVVETVYSSSDNHYVKLSEQVYSLSDRVKLEVHKCKRFRKSSSPIKVFFKDKVRECESSMRFRYFIKIYLKDIEKQSKVNVKHSQVLRVLQRGQVVLEKNTLSSEHSSIIVSFTNNGSVMVSLNYSELNELCIHLESLVIPRMITRWSL